VSCKGRLVGTRSSYSFVGIYSSLGAEFIELWGEIPIGGRVLGELPSVVVVAMFLLKEDTICVKKGCTIRAITPKSAKGSNYLC
jgi:hypothetical protein